MNSKIVELANKAGFVLWTDENWNQGNVVDWSSDYDKELEMFAELVINETVNWINENVGLVDEDARASLFKHFE